MTEVSQTQDWAKLTADLERLLKLRSFVFAMKLFEKREEMEAIPRIRRPQSIHTFDQVVGQASRLGWTVGITADNLVGAQCRAVIGLGNAKDAEWQSGKHMVGVWYSHRGRRHRAPGGDELRRRRPVRGDGGGAAGERPARPARHRAVLRHARRDDVFHQRAAMGRATRSSTGASSASRPAPIPGAAR